MQPGGWSILPNCCCAASNCYPQRTPAAPLPGALPPILVDEFQDTNRLQYAWLQLLAGGGAASSRWATTTRASTPSAAPRSATCATSSAITPPQRHPPGAELPLPRQHPRRRQRPSSKQPRAPGQEPVDRRRGRRADPVSRPIPTSDEARLDRRGGPRTDRATAYRRAEIALLYRSNAQSRVLEHELFSPGRTLPRLWRPALLRAPRIKHAWPAPDRQSGRRHRLPRVVNFPTRASAPAPGKPPGRGPPDQLQPLQRRRS